MDAGRRSGESRTPPAKLTYDDFLLFPDDGQRHELIDGEHYVILSKGTRRVDERTKRDLYDRVGVREYWVVDPVARAILVFRRAADGTFPQAARLEASNGDTLTTSLLPEFVLGLRPLFSA